MYVNPQFQALRRGCQLAVVGLSNHYVHALDTEAGDVTYSVSETLKTSEMYRSQASGGLLLRRLGYVEKLLQLLEEQAKTAAVSFFLPLTLEHMTLRCLLLSY